MTDFPEAQPYADYLCDAEEHLQSETIVTSTPKTKRGRPSKESSRPKESTVNRWITKKQSADNPYSTPKNKKFKPTGIVNAPKKVKVSISSYFYL